MADTLPLPHVRFSTTDYGRLIATGLLPERTELIDGELLSMAAQGIAHVECVRIISRLLERFETDDVGVYTQATASLTDDYAPDPDLYVTRLPLRSRDGLPAPDILLAIEVCDTTWARDYNIKRPRYAAVGIPEYWIVNLRDRQLVVCTAPRDGEYQSEQTLREDEFVQPTTFAARQLQVRALLPPAELPILGSDETA
jgi:Uma2 family endonuclease